MDQENTGIEGGGGGMRDAYLRDGYIIVPNVLNSEEVFLLRQQFEHIFNSKSDPLMGDGELTRNNVLSRFPEAREILFRDKVVKAIKELFGEKICVLPESSFMESSYGGWHKDTSSIELFGLDFHRDPTFNVANVAMYLQDNDRWGGGLDVVPVSHLGVDPYIERLRMGHQATLLRNDGLMMFLKRWAKKLLNALESRSARALRLQFARAVAYANAKTQGNDKEPGRLSIASRAGDLVIFNMNLSHKPTWPEERLQTGNHPVKYAFFTIMGEHNDASAAYHRYLLERAKTQYSYSYMFGGPPSAAFRESAKNAGVQILG